MIQAVITALLYIVILAIVVYLIIWVLTTVVAVPIPAKVIQLIWVAFALVCILILVNFLLPGGLAKLGGVLPLLA